MKLPGAHENPEWPQKDAKIIAASADHLPRAYGRDAQSRHHLGFCAFLRPIPGLDSGSFVSIRGY